MCVFPYSDALKVKAWCRQMSQKSFFDAEQECSLTFRWPNWSFAVGLHQTAISVRAALGGKRHLWAGRISSPVLLLFLILLLILCSVLLCVLLPLFQLYCIVVPLPLLLLAVILNHLASWQIKACASLVSFRFQINIHHAYYFLTSQYMWLFTLFAVSMTTSIFRFCAAMANNSSSSSPTSHASLVILSNSWKVVAFFGFPGVAGGGLFPALIRLEDKNKAVRTKKIRRRRKYLEHLEKQWQVWGGVWTGNVEVGNRKEVKEKEIRAKRSNKKWTILKRTWEKGLHRRKISLIWSKQGQK